MEGVREEDDKNFLRKTWHGHRYVSAGSYLVNSMAGIVRWIWSVSGKLDERETPKYSLKNLPQFIPPQIVGCNWHRTHVATGRKWGTSGKTKANACSCSHRLTSIRLTGTACPLSTLFVVRLNKWRNVVFNHCLPCCWLTKKRARMEKARICVCFESVEV